MSSPISFFQKYSQSENHTTNNTMLMLRHFYENNPVKFKKLIDGLLDDNINLGVNFILQEKLDNSVLDAVIRQHSFSISIETKADSDYDINQIKRHLDGINTKNGSRDDISVLILLSKESISENDDRKVHKYIKDNKLKVGFYGITFDNLLNSLKEYCSKYEENTARIIDDYESFLVDRGLLNDIRMIVYACGSSYKENKKYMLYYEPSDRPTRERIPFIGLYRNKEIFAFGTIGKAVYLDSENLSDDYKKRINGAINESPYNITKDSIRFYMIEDFQEVSIKKLSKGGIIKDKYLNLRDFNDDISKDMTNKEIKELIKDKTFE